MHQYHREVRKHASQMTIEEVIFLTQKLQEVKKWKAIEHFTDALNERSGELQKAISVLEDGKIIEYRQKNGKSRVTVRGNSIHNQQNACTVFEFLSNDIITFYWNYASDNHRNLNYNNYRNSLDIIQMVKEEEANLLKEKEATEKKYKQKLILELTEQFDTNFKNEQFKASFAEEFAEVFQKNLKENEYQEELMAEVVSSFDVNLSDYRFQEEFIADFSILFDQNLNQTESLPMN